MSAELFDTMEATEAPTRAGLAESQALAIVATVRKAVRGGVATKGDVDELKGDIGAVKAELRAFRRMMGLMLAIVPAAERMKKSRDSRK